MTNDSLNSSPDGTTGPGSTQDEQVIVPNDPASISFVKGLVANGQATRVPSGEKLPPGVTHEIIGETEAGIPILKRRRFSAF